MVLYVLISLLGYYRMVVLVDKFTINFALN
jgi:hypothetical protein